MSLLRFDLVSGLAVDPMVRLSLFSGRQFVDQRAVAAVVGLSTHQLHFYVKPSHWGVPGHWRYDAGMTFYAVDRLVELVDELIELGLVDSAAALDRWINALSGWPARRGWIAEWEEVNDA